MSASSNALAALIAGLGTRVTVPADAQPEPCQRCGEPTRVRVGGRPQHGGCGGPAGRTVSTVPTGSGSGQVSPTATKDPSHPETSGQFDSRIPAGPPPSTVAEMREVLSALDASRPRSQQTAPGPSELGTPCQRQLAMKLAGLPRQLPDKRPPWAAMQGTAIHGLMESALRFHNGQLGRPRWVIEERLHMDDEISGSGDAFDTDTGMVVDWKYVGVTALNKAKRQFTIVNGRREPIRNDQLISPDYRVQGHTYGYGHARKGRDVRWVRFVLLARSHDFDDSAEWTEPYRPDIAEEAIARHHATKTLINELGLAANPALWAVVPAAPSEDTCRWCPFHRPGGPADATGCPGYERPIKDHQDLLANIN